MKTALHSNGKLQIELTSTSPIEHAFFATLQEQARKGAGTVRVLAPETPHYEAGVKDNPITLIVEMDA